MLKLKQNNFIYLALPISVSALIVGIIIRAVQKKKSISKEVTEVTQNAIKEIDTTVVELKDALENKNANQLEKSIDNAVENCKNNIDKIGNQIKAQLKNNDPQMVTSQVEAS